ncbi:MAG: SCO family protein [Pseudomonadales bacterium]
MPHCRGFARPVALLLALICNAALAQSTVPAEADEYSPEKALATSQSAIGRQIANYRLRDHNGAEVLLADFVGKPLVVSLIYTSCYHICPTTTQYLHQVVKKARNALGEQSFNVLTIGFDTENDSPERMAQFAIEQGIADEGWYFLSANQQTIDELTRDLGFLYYASPKGFNHLVQSSVLDAEQLVYRQVYGMTFDIPLLVEPLKDLVFGRPREQSVLSALESRIRLFCTVYDPATDRYRVDYSVFIGTFVGILCCSFFGVQLVREWRRSFKQV